MVQTQQLPTMAQLGLILHRIFVDIRAHCYLDELDPKTLAEITDVAELIPLQFINRDEEYLEIIATSLRELAIKNPDAERYAAVLDMNADEVAAVVITPIDN